MLLSGIHDLSRTGVQGQAPRPSFRFGVMGAPARNVLSRSAAYVRQMDRHFREQIEHLGLTRKEAETYMAILEMGPATATDVASRTDVSKRHVYNIARKLEERQFVIINDYLNPTTIEPAPPDKVYERLQEEAEEVYRELESVYQDGMAENADIKVFKSQVTVVEKIQELVASADDRIAISAPVDFVPELREGLRDAVDRGVTVLLLVFEDQSRFSTVPNVSLDGIGHVIRYRESDIPVLLAIDREHALVAPRGVIDRKDSEVNAIFLGKSYLESVVFNALMNSSWVVAEELFTTPPEPLPHTFTNFRLAAINAALHRNDGTELRADVECRSSENAGPMIEVSGTVVGMKQRLVEPVDDADPGQCCMLLDVGNETVSIGGKDAKVEDYSAYSTTLRASE